MPPIRRKPHVVQVAALRGDRLVEADHLRNLVRLQVDPDELGPTLHNGCCGWRGRIDDPEIAVRIGHDALDAHEVIAGRHLVLLGVAPGIPLVIRVRFDLAVARHLGHRDRCILRPTREVDEDAPILRNGHSGHLVFKAGDLLQLRWTLRWCCTLLCHGCGGQERSEKQGHRCEPEHAHLHRVAMIVWDAAAPHSVNAVRTQPYRRSFSEDVPSLAGHDRTPLRGLVRPACPEAPGSPWLRLAPPGHPAGSLSDSCRSVAGHGGGCGGP